MRILLISFLLTLALNSAEVAKETAPQQYVVGLSPFLDRSVKDEVYRGLVRLLVEDLPLNSHLVIYDAFQIQSIAEVTVPKVRAFTSPKTRANQFAGAIQSLKRFLAEPHIRVRPTNQIQLHFDGAIRLPQFWDFLEDTLPVGGAALDVLLLGSPLYQDDKEPGFSMVDGYFPSDGHLRASREDSVYGGRAQTNELRSMAVHWAYFGDSWVNDLHQERVSRFWSLYLEKRAAHLDTFTGDLASALARFKLNNPAPMPTGQHWTIDPHDTKIEMRRISRNVELTDWITRDTVPDAAPPPDRLIGEMKIGIRWQKNIDLDLYAAPYPGGETLFFQHPRSKEGYYDKDHRSSPGRDYEFIEFERPVDVRQVEASVNFYAGSAPGGAQGEVRIEFAGGIYSAHFYLSASKGNRGRTGPGQEVFWTRIPVQEILKLPHSVGSDG
jgi:hypothetical protein